MSHMVNELDRHVAWIERNARELQEAVEQLVREANTWLSDFEALGEAQIDEMFQIINDRVDPCGHLIDAARSQVAELHIQLVDARHWA